MIPKLDNEINELFEKMQDAKYLAGENMDNMKAIIKELDEIEI